MLAQAVQEMEKSLLQFNKLTCHMMLKKFCVIN